MTSKIVDCDDDLDDASKKGSEREVKYRKIEFLFRT